MLRSNWTLAKLPQSVKIHVNFNLFNKWVQKSTHGVGGFRLRVFGIGVEVGGFSVRVR
jgi:hypothetical protein